MKKKAIIFDLWNTLVFRKGANLTSTIAEYFELPYDAVYEWIRLSSLAKDKSDKYYYVKMICQANGLKFKDEDASFFDALFDHYHNECEWIDGAEELLRSLKHSGYMIGVLSNSSEISYGVIEHFGLRNYADEIVLSCEVGFLKPDPRIFQNILKKLSLTENEVVMVGDKITTDVLGAKIMGMDIIFFNRDEVSPILNPNLSFAAIINKMSEILDILENGKDENNKIFSVDFHSGEQFGLQTAN